jgi:hypothetical protein
VRGQRVLVAWQISSNMPYPSWRLGPLARHLITPLLCGVTQLHSLLRPQSQPVAKGLRGKEDPTVEPHQCFRTCTEGAVARAEGRCELVRCHCALVACWRSSNVRYPSWQLGPQPDTSAAISEASHEGSAVGAGGCWEWVRGQGVLEQCRGATSSSRSSSYCNSHKSFCREHRLDGSLEGVLFFASSLGQGHASGTGLTEDKPRLSAW